MKNIFILLIPIIIIQHPMIEKPYKDTIKVDNWVIISRDTVSSIEYRPNSLKIFKDGKSKVYHRRFFTIREIKKMNHKNTTIPPEVEKEPVIKKQTSCPQCGNDLYFSDSHIDCKGHCNCERRGQ